MIYDLRPLVAKQTGPTSDKEKKYINYF